MFVTHVYKSWKEAHIKYLGSNEGEIACLCVFLELSELMCRFPLFR